MAEVPAAEVSFEDGFFQTIRNNQRFDIFDLARAFAENAAPPDDLRAPLAALTALASAAAGASEKAAGSGAGSGGSADFSSVAGSAAGSAGAAGAAA